jgi:hypothetical protein
VIPDRARLVLDGEIRRTPEVERNSPDFGKPSCRSPARLVGGVQSSQDAEQVANGLERKRRKLSFGHE